MGNKVPVVHIKIGHYCTSINTFPIYKSSLFFVYLLTFVYSFILGVALAEDIYHISCFYYFNKKFTENEMDQMHK